MSGYTIEAIEAPMVADALRHDPERILTEEVLTHDMPKLHRLLTQFQRGMMTAMEYSNEVASVIAERQVIIWEVEAAGPIDHREQL